ncbi:MAG: glycosyltransferase family 39 protein [bacterium]|nr:glycosyltransferase family 39 protein [bacterium]
MNLSNKTVNIAAILLLGIMLIMAVSSMKGDSLTFDELAHIPAGYSYLAKQDYRLNPEHPPLAKDISAIPLLFLDLNFPDNDQTWLQEESAPAWWVQFDFGKKLLYDSGNNPREIIFWSRFAAIIMLLLLGWILFCWTKKITNNTVALGVLTLFAFSPTFLAHGRLANTDVGAVFGALLAIIFWLKFLQKPSWKNVLMAGISFGIAMLFKFSLILLIPLFAIITILYVFLFSKSLSLYLARSLIVGFTGFILVIWPVYQFHIWNYPAEQQLRDTIADVSNHPIPIAKDIAIWMAQQEPLRAPAQYLRGLLMASQRTAWGNTTYYLGEISAGGQWNYFPLLYLLKIPLALHLLSLSAFCFFLVWLKKNSWRSVLDSVRKNFWAVALLLWIIIYWLAAIVGNLNIGIRHLLPIFPFIYILTVFGIYQILKFISRVSTKGGDEALISSTPKTKLRQVATIFSFFLLGLYILSSLSAFPYYLSYYNRLGGGTENGYKIAVDSNYDWGQDFYRLVSFVEKEGIDKIYLDYFGGEDEKYWLGEKYIHLDPKEIKEPPKGWLAVSLNQLMGGIAEPAPGFDQETGYYDWLKEYSPVARAGYSILIYRID